MLNDRVKVKTVIEIFRVWLYHLLLKAFFFLKFSSFANNFEKHQTWLIRLNFVQYFKKDIDEVSGWLTKRYFFNRTCLLHKWNRFEDSFTIEKGLDSPLPIKRQITKHPKSRMNETEQFKWANKSNQFIIMFKLLELPGCRFKIGVEYSVIVDIRW